MQDNTTGKLVRFQVDDSTTEELCYMLMGTDEVFSLVQDNATVALLQVDGHS